MVIKNKGCIIMLKPPMRLGKNGLELLHSKEQFRDKLYSNDGGNHCTIGWGHLVHFGPCNGSELEKPYSKGITLAEANKLLSQDIAQAVNAVNHYVDTELSQNQFDALVVFTYNIGRYRFARSTLLHLLNTLDLRCPSTKLQLEQAFLMWNKAGGKVCNGLINRRKAEIGLFFTGLGY